ncbi:MAG: phosphoribosylformylglycinamidine synthase [Clostridia bacterium]
MAVNRIYVEKKQGFDIPARRMLSEIREVLKINASSLRLFLRYDIEGVSEEDLEQAVTNVFSEPPTDIVYHENLPTLNDFIVFGVEFLEGQYDQRADSAEQCVELLLNKARPKVATAVFYAISNIDEKEALAVQNYLINPTDSRLAALEKPASLAYTAKDNDTIEYAADFIALSDREMAIYHEQHGFAMSIADLVFVRDYFKSENRNPSVTELKVIDTYWSDHCRHTTFLTQLTDIALGANREVKEGYLLYRRLFKELYKDKPDKYVCLMDIATIGAKAIKAEGKLDDLDESDEINACSIKVTAKVDGKEEDWLVMFKNETHNHPTEIEPYGGAATCLGGAIRDPLSGRVYVYHAMRITGAGDIYKDIKDTLDGKLPQRIISTTAAAGFSSYGNQIGLPAGIVNEIYHNNYLAKRMEAGFVIGAAPAANVVRKKPVRGDKIILLGGETGRDGCGGATGSSKAHDTSSVTECSAEVQKGNPLIERNIQRFFRNPAASQLIKKCNDFGAGGVSVAIGELADGLDIYLDQVPKKYKGLTVTETAISESQERMAVVVAEDDVDTFINLAARENLAATVVAEVTDEARLRMFNKGEIVVDIKRSFLDTNGVKQTAAVSCRDFPKEGLFELYSAKAKRYIEKEDYKAALLEVLSDKNALIQKGQSEMFDSTIGAASVFMPFGGKHQLTPALNMCAKLPVLDGSTDTASICSFAFNPFITDSNPYVGALYAVVASVAKLVAGGADFSKVRLTFQEYFKRLGNNKERFGEPFAALLGALYAQIGLGTPSIGGKDSMSGSFENIDVPNTLISFAVAVDEAKNFISNTFRGGEKLYLLPIAKELIPDFDYLKKLFARIHTLIKDKKITAATVAESGGALVAAVRSAIGNKLGLKFAPINAEHFICRPGDLIVAVSDERELSGLNYSYLGSTDSSEKVVINDRAIHIDKVIEVLSAHESIYPVTKQTEGDAENIFSDKSFVYPANKALFARPRVLIPVFPGTNCEYDTKKRFDESGAQTELFIFKNRTPSDIAESTEKLAKAINNSQIIVFPGGFSGGDEPNGSGKFIASAFRSPRITAEVEELLGKRDGLVLGICNGFQALIKLGLLPYGKIAPLSADSPTLTFNVINRHISTMVRTRISSTASPWLADFKVGDVFDIPVSHGEGRFNASPQHLARLIENGQIATQYADLEGNATMLSPHNPNGSLCAVEGIISPCGRIFGKMGHSERFAENLYKNIGASGTNNDMNIFSSGVKYYR